MDHPVQMNILNSKCQVKLQKLQTNKKREILKWKMKVKTPNEFAPKNTPFCHDFKSRVTIFKCNFLRPQESKWKSFSAHQQENYMQIPKLTLLLFLVPFLWELWPFKHGPAFFGTPCIMFCLSFSFRTFVFFSYPKLLCVHFYLQTRKNYLKTINVETNF